MSEEKPHSESPPELKLWECEIKPLKEGEQDTPWTVGDLRLLSCKGDFVERLVSEKIHIKFPDEKNKYLLKVIEPHSISQTHADLYITAYVAGSVKQASFEVTDGVNSFFTKDLAWEVKSVLDPQQKPTPFGPTEPLTLIWPLWFWGLVILPVLLLLAWGYKMVARRISRSRLLEELEAHQTALSPYNEFNKDMRKIHREYHSVGYIKMVKDTGNAREFFEDLDKAYRMYLTRELRVHGIKWKLGDILADIKKRNKKVFVLCEKEIRQILLEFEKAQEKTVTMGDCEQLNEMCKKSAARIFKAGGFQ